MFIPSQFLYPRDLFQFGRAKLETNGIYRDEYVASLKDRLSRVESLLKAAGILHEDSISSDELSEDEYEPSDEKVDSFHQRPQSSGQTSHVSFTSRASSGEVDYFPNTGDVEAAPIFRSHERDDSRYFGSLALPLLPLLTVAHC